MKLKLILLALVLASSARATTITIDLGPPVFRVPPQTLIPFAAPISEFNGQTLSLDFVFKNPEFLQFPEVQPPPRNFDILPMLRVSGEGTIVTPTGTGFLFDSAGNPVPGVGVAGLSGTDSITTIGFETFNYGLGGFFPNNARQDIFGVHIDLTLPVAPGFEVIGGVFGLFNSDGRRVAIGPLPDSGSTLGLLGLGVGALLLLRRGSKEGVGSANLRTIPRSN